MLPHSIPMAQAPEPTSILLGACRTTARGWAATNYVSKTLFAVSEFANIIRAGAKTISGEALLCANLGYGLRLVSQKR